MDTERVYMKSIESSHFEMKYQKPIQIANSEIATGESDIESFNTDGMLAEDVWMKNFNAEIKDLLEELDETQKLVRSVAAEIVAQRWIREMEERLEWERKRADIDILDEHERQVQAEHEVDMERLRREYERLRELKKGKCELQREPENNHMELFRREQEKLKEFEEGKRELQREHDMERLLREHERLNRLKEGKRGQSEHENGMELLRHERERLIEFKEGKREVQRQNENDLELFRREHERLNELNGGKRENDIECKGNVEDTIVEEITNSKQRNDRSVGCFGFLRKLFRRSKKTKRD